ncbi:MAG: YhcH/YjgK/YiaL family protein [Bacteroidales bacterium]
MIISNLSNVQNYSYLNSGFIKALKFLKKNDFSIFENGKYEIDGERMFAIVNEFIPKTFDEIQWEAHEQYAYIHFVFKGEEKFGLSKASDLQEISKYIPEKDITFYKGEGQFISIKDGDFIIFFPKEVYVSGLASGVCTLVKKVIIKIKIFNEK